MIPNIVRSRRLLVAVAATIAVALSLLVAPTPAAAVVGANIFAGDVLGLPGPGCEEGICPIPPAGPPPAPVSKFFGPYLTKTVTRGTDAQAASDYTRVDFDARVSCTDGVSVAGDAALIDRTHGYKGNLLGTGSYLQSQYPHPNQVLHSVGSVKLYDSNYPASRSVEVVLRLTLVVNPLSRANWNSCFERAGIRILRCESLGTPQIVVEVGFNPFDTNVRPRPLWHLAVGDSYSAGSGTRCLPGSGDPFGCGECRRSTTAWPAVLTTYLHSAAPNFTEFVFASCHGAQIAGMINDQLPRRPTFGAPVNQPPGLITVSISGNDLIGFDSDGNPAGFAPILRDCVVRLATSSCNPTMNLTAATAAINTAYQAVRQKAGPKTVVVVMLYPQILPATTGFTATCPIGFNDTELTRVRALWHAFDVLLAQRARAFGFEVADVENAFDGHLVCANVEWALGLDSEQAKSYHPNEAGNAAMAQAVQTILARPDLLARLQSP